MHASVGTRSECLVTLHKHPSPGKKCLFISARCNASAIYLQFLAKVNVSSHCRIPGALSAAAVAVFAMLHINK